MGLLDGILGAIGGGVTGGNLLSAGTSLFSGFLGMEGQERANQQNMEIAQTNSAFNASEAEKNRHFQEVQRETQYQTAVEDMIAAGLNPMLAYSQGGARPTGGSQGSAVQPAAMLNSAGAGITAAAQAASIQQTEAQTRNVEADTKIKLEQAPKVKWEARTAELESDIKVYEQRAASARDNYAIARAEIERDRLVAEARKLQAEAKLRGLEIPEGIAYSDFWKSTFGRTKPYVDYGAGAAGKIGSAALNFVPSTKALQYFKGKP